MLIYKWQNERSVKITVERDAGPDGGPDVGLRIKLDARMFVLYEGENLKGGV